MFCDKKHYHSCYDADKCIIVLVNCFTQSAPELDCEEYVLQVYSANGCSCTHRFDTQVQRPCPFSCTHCFHFLPPLPSPSILSTSLSYVLPRRMSIMYAIYDYCTHSHIQPPRYSNFTITFWSQTKLRV